LAAASLSALGRGLVLLGLAGIGVGGAIQAGFDNFRGPAKVGGFNPDAIARRVIVYRLDPRRATLFQFSQPIARTRIIGQPILKPDSAEPGEGWLYAYHVELLDSAGKVIDRYTIHARAALIRPDGSRRKPYRYFRDSDNLVALSDEAVIGAHRPIAAIRMLAGEADPDVVAIDVRVAEQRPLLDATAEPAFLRLSPDDRRRLAAPSAFPPELLTREERENLARNQWRPVGPVGIDGRDYRMSVLYTEEEDGLDNDETRGSQSEAGR
jgi:hypothetical protein